ncbi:MAG: plastocyanin [Gammaproteobacteria bacterium]
MFRTRTIVDFPNSHDVLHHVYSFSPAKCFELTLYHGNTASPITFNKPGVVVLGCNIHDRMIGYVYVCDSPYFEKMTNAVKCG